MEVQDDVWGNVALGILAKRLGIHPQVATSGTWMVSTATGGDNARGDQVAIDVGFAIADRIDGDWSQLTLNL